MLVFPQGWYRLKTSEQEQNMEQKIVTALSRFQFENLLNEFFRDGWKIVPGTIVICGWALGERNNNSEERYVAVITK
jgi:hypothetical protein